MSVETWCRQVPARVPADGPSARSDPRESAEPAQNRR
jgi:hypothetical protein